MSWSTPATFVTGNILTASQLNTYLRDNTNALRGMPRCRARRGSNLSLTSGVLTVITLDAEDIDTHGMHSTGSNTERETVQSGWAGDYLAVATMQIAGNTGGNRRYAEIQINGAVKLCSSDNNPSAAAGQDATFGLSTLWFPGVGDYFTLHGYQDSGGALNAEADGYAGTHLAVYFVGAGAG